MTITDWSRWLNGVIAILSIVHLLIVVCDLIFNTLTCRCYPSELKEFSDADRNVSALEECAERLIDGVDWVCFSVTFMGDFELWFYKVDTGFLALYTVELAVRLCRHGPRLFCDWLNSLDLFIIVSGLAMNVQFLMATHNDDAPSFAVLRLGRIFRVVRVVNMLSMSPFRVIQRLGLQSGFIKTKLRLRDEPDAAPRLPWLPSAAGKRWHLFLSHNWANQDVVATIKQQLLLLLPTARVRAGRARWLPLWRPGRRLGRGGTRAPRRSRGGRPEGPRCVPASDQLATTLSCDPRLCSAHLS